MNKTFLEAAVVVALGIIAGRLLVKMFVAPSAPAVQG